MQSLSCWSRKRYTTYQSCQLVVEARDSLLEYGKYLAIKFQVMVHTIEGRKQETRNFMKETESTTDKVANTPPGGRRDTWIGKLEQWRTASIQNQLMEEENSLCKQLVPQLAITDQTTFHLN